MRAREKEHKQKTIVSLGLPIFIAVLLIPGLDRRFGWSAVPLLVVIIADIIILAGYGLGVRVMRENRYAIRVPGVSAACQIPLNPRDLVTGLLIGAP